MFPLDSQQLIFIIPLIKATSFHYLWSVDRRYISSTKAPVSSSFEIEANQDWKTAKSPLEHQSRMLTSRGNDSLVAT